MAYCICSHLQSGGENFLTAPMRKIINDIISNPKWKVAIIWGLAIGCFDIFINKTIGNITWKSDHITHVISISPFIALILIALFSYFYLHLLLLGAFCGFASSFPYFYILFPLFLKVASGGWLYQLSFSQLLFSLHQV